MPRLPPVTMATCPLPGHRAHEIQQRTLRVFEIFLHAHQEGDGFLAVDDAVIVGERQIHHRADHHLAVHGHGPLLDLVHAENAGLRRVEDRRRHQRAIDAAIGDGEGAALHVGDLQLPVTRALAIFGDGLLDAGEGQHVGIAQHRHDQALVGADRHADVVVVLVDDVVAVDLGIDGRESPSAPGCRPSRRSS